MLAEEQFPEQPKEEIPQWEQTPSKEEQVFRGSKTLQRKEPPLLGEEASPAEREVVLPQEVPLESARVPTVDSLMLKERVEAAHKILEDPRSDPVKIEEAIRFLKEQEFENKNQK